MNYLEISLHIEQQLVKLLSLSEIAKYYALYIITNLNHL
ncbi:hypothetical protein Tu3298_001947 [Staphylococcus epidermidis]